MKSSPITETSAMARANAGTQAKLTDCVKYLTHKCIYSNFKTNIHLNVFLHSHTSKIIML